MKRLPKFRLGDLLKYRAFLFGFSALWIMFFHMQFGMPDWPVFAQIGFIKKCGNIGVDLFVLLSGVGLYMSMSKNRSIGRFYLRRIERVYVPFAVFVIIKEVVIQLVNTDFAPSLFIRQLLVFPWWLGYSVFWFVPFIMTMYLIYPLLFKLQKKGEAYMLIPFAISLALPFLMKKVCPEFYETCEIGYTRIPVFIVGCMIAPYVKRGAKISWLWALPIFAVGYLLTLAGVSELSRYSMMFFAFSVIMLLSAFCIAAEKLKILNKLYRFIAFFGGISLEIYLIFTRLEYLLYELNNIWKLGIDNVPISLAAGVITVPMAYALSKGSAKLVKFIGARRAKKPLR